MDAAELIAELRSVESLIARASEKLEDGMPGMPDDELGKLVRTHQALISQLAAIPEEFEKLKVWVLEVRGQIDRFPDLNSFDPAEFEISDIDNISSLAKNIRLFLEDNEFQVSDAGFNNEIWHIGIWCTNEEAAHIYECISEKFKKAIQSELITLHRVFWDFRLPKALK